jgi:hypothetical protein
MNMARSGLRFHLQFGTGSGGIVIITATLQDDAESQGNDEWQDALGWTDHDCGNYLE